MKFDVHTELEIEASAADVWAALTAMGKRDWDPVMRRFQTDLAPGAKATILLKAGALPLYLKVRLSRCVEQRELEWKGGIPLLMKAAHGFRIEALGDNKVRFVHYENFTGPLLFLLKPILKGLPTHYSRMNEAISKRARGK